jgi:DNA polymerase III gamma/tau subunit
LAKVAQIGKTAIAKYLAKWQNTLQNGKIFGEMAKYLAKWQNISQNGKNWRTCWQNYTYTCNFQI